MMLKKTKIVASISDLRCDVDFIRDLFNAGMNVVRMNTAHASREGFEQLIANVREVSNRIGILMDTKGPEVRTTKNAEDTTEYKTGDRVKIIGNPEKETVRGCIYVTYPNFVNDLSVGAKILIDDGDLELRVTDKDEEALYCEVCNDATLASRKSVNVPGVRINLPSLTEKDRNNILYAIEKDIDFIAHSFVRNKQDVLDIREILNAYGSDIKIIAKIENQEGVDNIDEIGGRHHGSSRRFGHRSTPGTYPRHTTYLNQKMYLSQKAGYRSHTNVAHDDQQSTSDTGGSHRHRQCHLLPYGCPDAERRDGLRQVSGRGRAYDGYHRGTG